MNPVALWLEENATLSRRVKLVQVVMFVAFFCRFGPSRSVVTTAKLRSLMKDG